MNTNPKRYLITAALPYANGLKHIGHLAGAYLPADIYVRYLKAQKRDVVFVCGSDEHGTAIPIQAMKEGTTAQATIDKYHPIIEQNFKDLGIEFDMYHRTSAPLHHETAQAFFNKLNANGDLEVKETEQYFDEATQTFLADRYIKGTCPVCANPNAFGDQCEKCGSSLSPEMLINPVSTLSGNAPIKKATKHWYLPLNRHEDFLRKWILEDHKNDWRTSVVGQCKSWIDGGLQPRAVTRDLDWGVKIEGEPGKVLYVWFDAPIGYISATKQWAIENEKDWKPYWFDADTKLVHFVGKDNIVFHCIIFPVMLKLNGNILPTNVPANEFMNLEGDKMSTSRGWSIEMDDYINDWVKPENGGGQMADALRYYLTAIAPETKDSEFTWKGFHQAYKSELSDILGNFVNRTFVLMHKLCGGKVPVFHNDLIDEKDKSIITAIAAKKETIESYIEEYKFRDALFEVIDLARLGNRYMQEKEPWIVAKQVGENGKPTAAAQQLIDNCLHICLQLTANLTILIHPFLPFTAKKLMYMMKVTDRILEWKNAGSMKLLSVGYSLREPQLLFRKIENEEIDVQLAKLKAKSAKMNPIQESTSEAKTVEAQPTYAPIKSEIVFDDFAKIDLRVGTIVAAEKVEKADKLLKLQVDLGFETRTIVSGIALHFQPEEIVGKQVTVVCNLAPRKMRGIESNGMILMAEDNGKLHFINPEQAIGSGATVS